MKRALELITACILVDSMLYILLPVMYSDLGIAHIWQVGLLLAANRLFRLPMSPWLRFTVESIGVYRSLQLAAALAVVTSVGYAFAYGFWAWLALRMIWGFAWGLFRLSGYVGLIQAPLTEGNAASAGMMQRAMQLGSLFGLFLGGWLAEQWGLDWTVILFAMLMGLVWVRFEWSADRKRLQAINTEPFDDVRGIRMYRNPAQVENLSMLEDWKQRFRRLQEENPLRLWTQAAVIYFVSYAIHVLTSVYLLALMTGPTPDELLRLWMLGFGGAVAWAGWLHGFRFLVQAGFSVRIGKWIDNYGMNRHAWAAGLGVSIAGLMLLPLTLHGPVWLGMLLWMVSLWMASILGMWLDAFAIRDAKQSGQLERRMSGFSFSTDFGAALAPIVSFALLDAAGWFGMFAGFALMYAGCIYLTFYKGQAEHDARQALKDLFFRLKQR